MQLESFNYVFRTHVCEILFNRMTFVCCKQYIIIIPDPEAYLKYINSL